MEIRFTSIGFKQRGNGPPRNLSRTKFCLLKILPVMAFTSRLAIIAGGLGIVLLQSCQSRMNSD